MSGFRTSCHSHGNRPTRALDVLWFNYPTYVLSIAVIVGAAFVLTFVELPGVVRLGLAGGAILAGWWLIASTLAAAWVFELSGVTRWKWLPAVLSAPATWLNITTGFDDTTEQLRALLAPASGIALDLFDSEASHDGSIRRARASRPPVGRSIPPGRHLPLDSASFDAVFLLMAAHEIRDTAARRVLFAEAERVLKSGGRLVLVEHLLTPINAVVFGPGVLHFYDRGTWLEAATSSGLRLVRQLSLTPFATAFVFGR